MYHLVMAVNNININIDLSSFSKLASQIVVRVGHLTTPDLIFIILSLLLPPLAVFLKVGLTVHFWINVILTILGWMPGVIHALWVVLFL